MKKVTRISKPKRGAPFKLDDAALKDLHFNCVVGEKGRPTEGKPQSNVKAFAKKYGVTEITIINGVRRARERFGDPEKRRGKRKVLRKRK